MKIGIVGGGVVGRATARTYLEHVDEVRVHDVLPERRTHPLDEVLACDLIFLCLPTPVGSGGRHDLSSIEQFFSGLIRFGSGPITANLVLRSTVPIGTTRRLREVYDSPNLVHSPEFLTARCAVTDAQLPARNIIGNPSPPDGSALWSRGNGAAEALNILYQQRFPGIPIHLVSSDESEAVKLICNGFFAVKVAFFNEVYQLVKAGSGDWRNVLAAVLADGRVGASHTRVPGPSGEFGFGGNCLPKDLSSLIACINDAGLCSAVTSAAQQRNVKDRLGCDPE